MGGAADADDELRERNDRLLDDLAEAQARLHDAEVARDLAEQLAALARDFLMATKVSADVLKKVESNGPMGPVFHERVAAQQDLNELQRWVLVSLADSTTVGRDYAHIDDVASFVEDSVEAKTEISRRGVGGLAAIAALIRRREFRRGSR